MIASLQFSGKLTLLSTLFIAVLMLALAVVYTKHMNRKYFMEWQTLQMQRDDMNVEWKQLLLERSTFTSSSEVERSARDKLGMDQPVNKEIILVK